MLVRISSGLMLAMLLGGPPVAQAKTFPKIDSLAKRLLNRTVSAKNAILNSKRAIVGAVGIAALSCGTMACEKIQQPMIDGFTRSGDPSVGFNVNHYNMWSEIGGSYHAYNVDNPEASGIIGDNVTIPINFHSRLLSFGDFRLSIGDGFNRTSIYGVADSTSGSFIIHDAWVDGKTIGNGVHANDHTLLIISVDGFRTINAKIYHPQIDTANDSIGRAVEIKINFDESGETITYQASANWEYSLNSSLIHSPSSLLMPSYQQVSEVWGKRQLIDVLVDSWGKGNFGERLIAIGASSLTATVEDSIGTNVYTATGVSGRKRIKKSGGLTQYWDESSFSGVDVMLTVSDDVASVSLRKSGSNHLSDIPVGGTVTLGSGFETHNWTLQLGGIMADINDFYRSMSLSAISTSDFRAFNFIGNHVDQSSQYYIENAQLKWDISGSLTASGW